MSAFGEAVQALLEALDAHERDYGPVLPASNEVLAPHLASGWRSRVLAAARARAEVGDEGMVAWLSPGWLQAGGDGPRFLEGGVLAELERGAGCWSRLRDARRRPDKGEALNLVPALRRTFGKEAVERQAAGPAVFLAVVTPAEHGLIFELAARRARGELGRAACCVLMEVPSAGSGRGTRRVVQPQEHLPAILSFVGTGAAPEGLDRYLEQVDGIQLAVEAVKLALAETRSPERKRAAKGTSPLDGLKEPARALDVLGGAGLLEAFRLILELRRTPEAELALAIADGRLSDAIGLADRLRADAEVGFEAQAAQAFGGVHLWLGRLTGVREPHGPEDAPSAVRPARQGADLPGGRAARLAELCMLGGDLHRFYHRQDEDLRRGGRAAALRAELDWLSGDEFAKAHEPSDLREPVRQLQDGTAPALRLPDVRFYLPRSPATDQADQPAWMRGFEVLEGPPVRLALPASIIEQVRGQWLANVERHAGPGARRFATVRHLGGGRLRFVLSDEGEGFDPARLEVLRRRDGGLARLLRSGWFKEAWLCSRREGVPYAARLFPEPPVGSRPGDPEPPERPTFEHGTAIVLETDCFVDEVASLAGAGSTEGLVVPPDPANAVVLLLDDASEHRGPLQAWLEARAARVEVVERSLAAVGASRGLLDGSPRWDAIVVHLGQGTRRPLRLRQGDAALALLGVELPPRDADGAELAALRLAGARAKGGAPILVVTGDGAAEAARHLGPHGTSSRIRCWNWSDLSAQDHWEAALRPQPQQRGLISFEDARGRRHRMKNFVRQVSNRLAESPPDRGAVLLYFEDREFMSDVRDAALFTFSREAGARLAAAIDLLLAGVVTDEAWLVLTQAVHSAELELEETE